MNRRDHALLADLRYTDMIGRIGKHPVFFRLRLPLLQGGSQGDLLPALHRQLL